METVTVRTIELTWRPEARLATIRFLAPTHATGEDGAALVRAMVGWIGSGGEAFALLGDGAGLHKVDAGYRAAWSGFFQKHRHDSVIAFYNMGPVIRIVADMFRIGTGVQLRAFSGEERARAWLRERGIPA